MMSVYIVHTFIIFRCIRFEKERQWLCVRMYVCASLFLGDNEPKKKIHHQWWVLSQVDSFSRLGLVYQKCFLFHDHNYHVCFSDTGEGLRLRSDIVTPSLSLIYADYKPTSPKLRKSKSNSDRFWEESHPSFFLFLLQPERSLMELILSEFYGASHASSADR